MTEREELAVILDYYDRQVIWIICNKYGFEEKDALRRFFGSETYRMLRNPNLEMWDFSPTGIFDLWECEQITGNPRNSLYIRRD